ncbi:LytR/AlgR family response regulator transcription factor [Lutibacter flavus]|uniref:Two component transcriptional regulator, LytTR family n=1 Tax=Lutibacter flavus TaxID=691689 RepID=A0A238ZID3_9FLAO|nr:LytTR family DNA-binding domain-containing protein [Lutibacter flavus]SNR83097.1 two component transcriptional regulator, LytTR family [Lutibacter flavus]
MKINTLIIDDEALARQRLINLVNDVPELELIGECSTGKEAISAINEYEPDVIFLDIQMKDLNGFDVLQKITVNKKPLVVFVTAYNEYALKAFDFFAFDYLLKPYKDERFFKSIENIINFTNNKNYNPFDEKINDLLKYIKITETSNYSQKLPIKLGNKVYFIDLNDIKYIIASGYYAEIITNDKKHLLRESLSNLIESLDPNKFIRIHRSTIINLKEIGELIHSNYGEIDVKMNDKKLFRVSKSYKKMFLTKMGL